MSADYCIRSKNVYLGGDDLPAPACVYVCGKTIESVGGYEPDPAKMDSHTSILDMGEKLVMPGLIDAHTHFFAGAISESRYVVSDLGLCSSEEECAEKVAAFAKANPDLKRIRGAGWFITNWGKGAKLPTKKSLDRLLPDIPVYLKAADAHSFWVNSAALKECGVTKETTVSTGFIGRFPDGEPDGMLVEYEAASYAEAKFSDFTPAELKEIYLSMLDKAAAMGVTALSEMMPDDYDGPAGERLKIIKEIDEEGKLPLTLSIYPTLFNSGNFDNFFALKDQYDSENIKIAGVKGF
ncbi:MAG: amidohydrolase family protein, partial [Eubacterium sp.]|nr:amidohydrolase family protein [Eubacterium sp.]